MEATLVLVIRSGSQLGAIRRIWSRLGVVSLRKVFHRSNETIIWVEAPLGHEVYRWFHEENSDLIWFHYNDGTAPS